MPVIWQNCLWSVDSVPVIWLNCLYVEERASDLAELPVPVIWKNCLWLWRSVPVIWAELPVPVDLAELFFCGQCASDLPEFLLPDVEEVPVIWQKELCLSVDSVPVIRQNCLSVEECASDLAELPVCGGACQ